jgi:putative transposase
VRVLGRQTIAKRARCFDSSINNVFIERFWRSIKYEEVYLRAYDDAAEAKHYIGRYIRFYNEHRPHSSLDGRTPNAVYCTKPTEEAA